MAIDKREDAGQYYPGGSVTPRGPVTPGGGTPADYAIVRENAETGAEHAAVTSGNPHGTTFASLPDKPSVFPPELVSDLNNRPEARGKAADAQDVFDKLAGRRDYTDLSYSFWKGRQAGPLFKADDPAAGWENAEWQLTWRKAPAGGGSAGWWLTYRKTGTSFFTAGDSGLSHIEFYSEGYLLDTLDLTSGGPIALVSQLADKLSISEVVEPSADAKTGQAADAKAVATALEGKLSTELSGNSQTIRSSGIAIRLDFSTVNGAKISLGASENGSPYIGVDDGKGTRDSQKVLRLPTTFFGLIETLAVASQLSGVTSQDITDFLHYDPTAFIGDDLRLQHDVEAGTICRYGSNWYFRVITDAAEGEDVAFIDKTDYTSTDGFRRLIDLYGKTNSQLVKTIEEKAVKVLVCEKRTGDTAERIYDGDTKLTSYKKFLTLIQSGRVVLQATATPSSGSSPVLFRPQLMNNNVVLFDATGEIGGVIRTRNIQVKRVGTDGIEVVSGVLRQIVIASDIAVTAVSSASQLAHNRVAVVDGSNVTKVDIEIAPHNGLRACELLIENVPSDGAVTLGLPPGKYQFSEGASEVSAGNNFFFFGEYAEGCFRVTKSVTTEVVISDIFFIGEDGELCTSEDKLNEDGTVTTDGELNEDGTFTVDI